MRILLTINGLDPAEGGTTSAVLQLAGALAASHSNGGPDVDIHLAAHTAGGNLVPPEHDVPVVFLPRSRDAWDHHVLAIEPDVIHDHGIWLRSNRSVATTARRLGLPRVVSTHGMLAPWARRHHAWRKGLAWGLFQRHDLDTAAAIHATSDAEAADISASGVRAPVVVVPHGVNLPLHTERAHPGAARRRAVFIGRLHPVKGLPGLIDAWADARPEGWELVIAGPDAGGHRAALERRRDAAGLQETITFRGLLDEQGRAALLAEADLFVLPSLSENFGVAVAEALAAGVPAIVSRRAPWAAVESARAGWWVEPDAASLAGALRAATRLSDEDRASMGAAGRGLVERDFAWPAVAERMLRVYEGAMR